MARETRQEETNRERKQRVPLGVPRQKLTVKGLPDGSVGRWVNDDGNRLNEAQEGGYRFLNRGEVGAIGDAGGNDPMTRDGVDSRISRVVGTKTDGSPMRAYLMHINREWYEEDQEAKQQQIDEQESAMRRGADRDKIEHGYIPKSGIKIESKRA